MSKLQELVRNADGSIPDPVGFDPFDRVGVKTRYADKSLNGFEFPLDHIHCLHESDWCVTLYPDLEVRELVVQTSDPWEEHRFHVTMPKTVTDQFYDRLEMYEKVSPEQFGVERE